MDVSRLNTLNLNNSNDIIANNISLINGNTIYNIFDLFSLKQNVVVANSLNISSIIGLQALLANTYTKSQNDALLLLKSNLITTYSKIESDNNYYTKSAIDSLLLLEANQLTTYNKIENDALLLLKSNVSTTYSKTDMDLLLALKQGVIPSNGLSIGQINGLQLDLDSRATITNVNNNLALKQQLIGVNGLNINQVNLLQSSLDLKIASNLVYTKTEDDALLLLKSNVSTTYSKTDMDSLLNLKTTKTDLSTALTTLNIQVSTPATNTSTVGIRGGSGEDGTLILSSVKGSYTSNIHNGSGANIQFRSGNASGFVSFQDMGSRNMFGGSSQFETFSNTFATSTAF